MTKPDAKQIQQLLKSGQFDAEWYLRSYPDVSALGMDPAEHYLTYGQIMGRATSAIGVRVAAPLAMRAVKPIPTPDMSKRLRILVNANEVAKYGDHPSAIALAEAHLPADLAYTANVLRANAAIAEGDEKAWQTHLNNYLSHFDLALIRLQGAGTLFDRLACDPLPKVTGGPLISVIMPAWNAEKTVRKAAQSILNQTWGNLELLIVDDYSTDGTWSILQQIAASDSRVKIMRNKVNVGPYVSKNVALLQAKGEWITGHDADDWALPQRLERHMNDALSKSIKASLTYMLRMLPNGTFEHFTPIGSFSFDGTSRVASISTLFNSIWMRQSLGFWDSVRFGADSEIISRARIILGDGFKEYYTIGMICLDLPSSLTNDPHTGIRTDTGLSNIRRKYKESWKEFHLTSQKDDLMMSFPLLHPKYNYDESHFVSHFHATQNIIDIV